MKEKEVCDVFHYDGSRKTASIESKSNHPLRKAVVEYDENVNVNLPFYEIIDFEK